MRVKLLTENSTTPELVDALQDEGTIEVESTAIEKDLTEQAFGLAEAGVVVAIVKGSIELATAIWKFARRPKAQRSTVEIETPVGKARIELSQEISVADIQALLDPLFVVK